MDHKGEEKTEYDFSEEYHIVSSPPPPRAEDFRFGLYWTRNIVSQGIYTYKRDTRVRYMDMKTYNSWFVKIVNGKGRVGVTILIMRSVRLRGKTVSLVLLLLLVVWLPLLLVGVMAVMVVLPWSNLKYTCTPPRNCKQNVAVFCHVVLTVPDLFQSIGSIVFLYS